MTEPAVVTRNRARRCAGGSRHRARRLFRRSRGQSQRPDTFWSWAWDECGVVGERGVVLLSGRTTLQPRRSFLTPTSTSSRHCWPVSQSPKCSSVSMKPDHAGPGRVENFVRCGVRRGAYAARGVGPGDRVAAWAPNVPEVVIWARRHLSIGAVVSTASPDFRTRGDRSIRSITPRLLLVGSTYTYGGRQLTIRGSIDDVLAGLPDVIDVVVIGDASDPRHHPGARGCRTHRRWIAFESGSIIRGSFFFQRYSPVHRSHRSQRRGVMLKDLAEQRIHLDITPGDRVCYYTTAGWMMWNWLVMALGTGATVVLADGQTDVSGARQAPAARGRREVDLPRCLGQVYRVAAPALVSMAPHELAPLRTIASTGSPLAPELFDYVYMSTCVRPCTFASDFRGTDICGCFVLRSAH